MSKKLSASMEDYLEIIYLLVKKNKLARVKDIAEHLGVKKPSVTGALRLLSRKELIRYTPYGYIDMTEAGEKIAQQIFRRHDILKQFLTKVLQINPEDAENDACKIEHAISDASLEKLINFVHFVEHCPRVNDEIIASFAKFCKDGVKPQTCKSCLEEVLKNLSKVQKDKKPLKVVRSTT